MHNRCTHRSEICLSMNVNEHVNMLINAREITSPLDLRLLGIISESQKNANILYADVIVHNA